METAVIIESEEITRKFLREHLANEGLRTEEAPDGQKGIAAVRAAQDPMVVFLAERLPGLSGVDTLIALRKFQPKVPIVMLMTGDNRQASQLALSRGASWFLNKPLRVEDLLVYLRGLQDRRRLLQTADLQLRRLQVLERQAAELTTLGTGELVPSELKREDDFLRRTIDLIADVLDAKKVSLMLLDEEKGELYMAHSNWILPSKLSKIRQPVSAGVAGRVVREAKPVLVTDVKKDPRSEPNEFALQYESASFICTPLMHRRRVIGTISANDKKGKEPFTESDLAILNTFASQISTVIANLAMVHRLEREHLKLTFVNDIVNALVSSLDPAEIYRSLLEKVGSGLRATAGAILVGDAAAGTLHYEAVYPEDRVRRPAEDVPMGKGAMAQALRKGRPVVVNGAKESAEVDADSDFPKGLERRSLAVAPLKAKGKVLGLLAAYNKEGGLAFDEWDLEILEAILPQAAMALKQAWLYQNLIKTIDEVVEGNKQLEMANAEIRRKIEELNRVKKKVSP